MGSKSQCLMVWTIPDSPGQFPKFLFGIWKIFYWKFDGFPKDALTPPESLQSWNTFYHLNWFCQYLILFVISCNISLVTISDCMDITSINSVWTAICFTYINLVVKKDGPDPPYQSNIHPPHTYLTMLPFSAVTNSLQLLATNQVHTQSQSLMAKFDP